MRAVLTPFNVLSLLLLALAAFAYERAQTPPPIPPAPRYGTSAEGEALTVTLHFASKDAQAFETERREVKVPERDATRTAQAMVRALVEGPSGDGVPLVPRDADVPNVWVRGGHVIVDLPVSYSRLQYGVSGERTLLCGFTRTLLGVRGARDVTFLVGSKNVDSLLGFLDLRDAFTSEDCPDS